MGTRRDRAKIARYKHDHDYVNKLLDASIPEAFDRLIRRHHCATTRWLDHAGRLTRWCTMELLTDTLRVLACLQEHRKSLRKVCLKVLEDHGQ